MTDPNRMKDWELQNDAPTDDQWQLLDAEQELPPELRLSADPSDPAPDWVPLGPEERSDRSGGRNWVLSLLIIFAMLAVVGYIAWLGFGGVGFPGISTADPTPLPTDEPLVAAVPTVAPAQEDAPTATPEATVTPTDAPTATPAPVLIDQTWATVDSEYGLNVRAAPSPDAEIIAVVDNGASFQVTDQTDAYAQIVLTDGRVGWVSTDFVILGTRQVEAPPEFIPTPTPTVAAAEAPQAVPTVGETAVLTTGVEPPPPYSSVIPDGPAVIVQEANGVNARTDPALDAAVVQIVPQGAAVPATAISDDGEWYQVALPTDETGWMFATAVETVNVDGLTGGDTTVLPTPTAAAEQAAGESAPATAPVDAGAAVTETVAAAPTATPSTGAEVDIVPTLIIDNLIGFGARTEPATDADTVEFLSGGTEWPAVGRNDAADWVQVELADGRTAWVHAGTAQLNVDIATLPVVQP